MDYNQLKLRVLLMLEQETELDSFQIREQLKVENVVVEQKAVEMALMRYWRQGLLGRTRKGRRFQYTLTERGRARRVWLVENQTAKPR